MSRKARQSSQVSAEKRAIFNVGTSGLIVNQFGELLVIQRNDTRTWALPGGSLDAGEMPTDGVIREVEEETGFKVLPVRLVAVHYIGFKGRHTVQFLFRCLMRGGVAKTSIESPQVGYIKTNPLPVRMLKFHKRQIEQGLNHLGSATLISDQLTIVEQVLWQILSKGIYTLMNMRRRIKREATFVSPDKWRLDTLLVIRDEAGGVLWTRHCENGAWQLPGQAVALGEAPWDAAQRMALDAFGLYVRIAELALVLTEPEEQALTLVFMVEPLTGSLVRDRFSAEIAFCQPGSEHPNTSPQHVEAVAAATDPERELTLFKMQESPDPTAS